MPCPRWRIAGGGSIVLDRARIMAILNVTPDSFSDGGNYLDPGRAAARAEEAVAEGADLIDIGGESTRPGAARVGDEEQMARVVPALRRIRAGGGALGRLPISVDTTRASVAAAALDAGADIINDQSAGRDDPGMVELVAKRGAGIVLMHRLLPPEADSYSHRYAREPDYGAAGVVAVVRSFLMERAGACAAAGIDRACIVIDPGIGFGKSVDQNWDLARGAAEFVLTGFPVLCAVSRKSFIGAAMAAGATGAGGTDKAASEIPPPEERVAGSIAVAVAQFLAGVRLFRVHDVASHRSALDSAYWLGGRP